MVTRHSAVVKDEVVVGGPPNRERSTVEYQPPPGPVGPLLEERGRGSSNGLDLEGLGIGQLIAASGRAMPFLGRPGSAVDPIGLNPDFAGGH